MKCTYLMPMAQAFGLLLEMTSPGYMSITRAGLMQPRLVEGSGWLAVVIVQILNCPFSSRMYGKSNLGNYHTLNAVVDWR
ncbi:MAG: hypothetical protein QG575_1594 [Euryarchaeota archaeon]|nr:hypothetical protein [Euryarchaeota archaeon]